MARLAARVLWDPRLPGRGRPGTRELARAIAGRTILLTGASSGIGEETALRIGEARGEVVLVARRQDRLDDVAERVRALGGVAHVLAADLSDAGQVERLVAELIDRHDGVDVLINNAGKSIRRTVADSYERFHDVERTMSLNYYGPVRLILGLLPGMCDRGGGHIVNVSSTGVQLHSPRFAAYLASKAALDTFSDAVATETMHEGIRWTTVYMPLVRTPMIGPSPVYDRVPSLNGAQASGMLVDAMVRRPRRVSTPVGDVGAFVRLVAPLALDRALNGGFIRVDEPSI